MIALYILIVAVVLSGCSTTGGTPPLAAVDAPTNEGTPAPISLKSSGVVAIVNNEAITLDELAHEAALHLKEEREHDARAPEERRRELIARLIDQRLLLQEANREKIRLDDTEFNEEFFDRIKRYGVTDEAEFERLISAPGVTLESVKKRLRNGLRVSKLLRRKVAIRISVSEDT